MFNSKVDSGCPGISGCFRSSPHFPGEGSWKVRYRRCRLDMNLRHTSYHAGRCCAPADRVEKLWKKTLETARAAIPTANDLRPGRDLFAASPHRISHSTSIEYPNCMLSQYHTQCFWSVNTIMSASYEAYVYQLFVTSRRLGYAEQLHQASLCWIKDGRNVKTRHICLYKMCTGHVASTLSFVDSGIYERSPRSVSNESMLCAICETRIKSQTLRSTERSHVGISRLEQD